jgi:hypothetical protein
MTTKLSRRAAMTGLAAIAPAAAAIPAIAAAAHPDAELLALDRQLHALLPRFAENEALPDDHEHPAWDPIWAAIDAAPDDDPHSKFWGDPRAWQVCHIQDEWYAAYDRIMTAKPTTNEGLAVMARAYLLEQDQMSHNPDAEGNGERLAHAVLSFFGIAPPANEFTERFEERIRNRAA